MGVPGFPNVITISDCGKIHFRYTSLFYIKICFRMGPVLKSVVATLTGAPRGSPRFAGTTQVRVEQQAALHKEPACQCRGRKRLGFDPWGGKISWSGKRQPTPVFLPGESHGWRSLAGYSPWGFRESDTTEHTRTQSPGGRQAALLSEASSATDPLGLTFCGWRPGLAPGRDHAADGPAARPLPALPACMRSPTLGGSISSLTRSSSRPLLVAL